MDQSNCTDKRTKSESSNVRPPRRSFTVEFFVGLFTLITMAAAAYLAVGLGDFKFSDNNRYTVYAEFDNVAGLKYGAPVEIAGVPVGEVSAITLNDSIAVVKLRVDRGIEFKSDDIASIRTKGIIGDRYVKISRGASSDYIPEDGTIVETESVVDIEDIIGKIVHNLGGE